MKEHEKAMLQKSGLLSPPKGNKEIDEALRWFYETTKLRNVDYDNGMYSAFTPMIIDDLCRAEYTPLSFEYLCSVATALDQEYRAFLIKSKTE